MSTDTLQDFVEARLRAYDPLIDLTPGSPAEEQVVIPIVTRFQPDPLEMDIASFIAARMAQELPDVSIDEGTGVMDFLIKPDQILMDPVIREVQLIKQGQSLANPELLADAEADALVANFFITRNLGGLATGRVRLYFNAPVAINITIGNVCYTADGHRYLPTTLQSISAEAMLFNSSGNLYYFDINVTAEAGGDDYNIAAGLIVGITNLSVAVRATNISAFTGGLLSEDTPTLVARAQQSITERSLVVPRGTIARLQDQFSDMTQIQVIGTGDVEMQRDLVTGGDRGPALLSGNDGYAVDDGKGGTTTTLFTTQFGDFTQVFVPGTVVSGYLQTSTVAYGGDGSVDGSYLNQFMVPLGTRLFTVADIGSTLIMIKSSSSANLGAFKITGLGLNSTNSVTLETSIFTSWVGAADTGISWMIISGQQEYLIEEVLNPTTLRVSGNIPFSNYPLAWSLRKQELTLSNIPGGILFGDQANTMPSNEIHIGGCTDFYVRGANTSQQLLPLSNITDESPLVASEVGVIDAGNSSFLYDASVYFLSVGVQPGMFLQITSTDTGNEGSYQIVRVGIDPSGSSTNPFSAHYVQVTPSIPGSSSSSVTYNIRAKITVDLVYPKTIKGSGEFGVTGQLTNVFNTTNLTDFVSLGVASGDILRILSGSDAGDYIVNAVSGTGNTDLILSRQTMQPATGIEWEVFSTQPGLNLPLVRISEVTLLDGSMTPTSTVIPFATPVDARSTNFGNVAHGTKVSVTEARVGIIGTVDLYTMSPLPSMTLVVAVNGVSQPGIVLTGAASVGEVVNRINSVIPNIAHTVTPSGGTATYLTLNSIDRHISVVSVPTGIGLVNGDDSRQIISSDVTWNDARYDLRPTSDVVEITVGEDVGSFYLVGVESNRILVVGFNEITKDVMFLTPCVGVSLTVGSRSLGTARVYFLEPTSFEVRGSYRPSLNETPANQMVLQPGEVIDLGERPVTYFSVPSLGLRFIPDPTLSYGIILNELSIGTIANNMTIGTAGVVTSDQTPAGDLGYGSRCLPINFVTNGVRIGDLINFTYQPIQGTVDLTTPPSMAGLSLVLKVAGKVYTIVFSAVGTPSDIVSQINKAITDVTPAIASITTAADSKQYLMLEADVRILILSGTAVAPLGLMVLDNESYAASGGPYRVSKMFNTDPTNMSQIVIVDEDGVPPIAPPDIYHSNQAHHFTIQRAGIQRLHSTAMANNTEFGLYYMDVELVSDGSGDIWNIPEGMVFVVTGYTSDGYTLAVADSNLTYSISELVKIQISNSILAVGQSDQSVSASPMINANIQLTYDMSPLVSSIQSFATAELDRVLTASILVRHLQPSYVNFDLNYSGGSTVDVITADIATYLAGLSPNDNVDASSVQDIPKNRGASFVTNPITLLTVTHDESRNIVVDRSENYVSHSRLSTFFPGVINTTQS
jgi:hypothetical protein